MTMVSFFATRAAACLLCAPALRSPQVMLRSVSPHRHASEQSAGAAAAGLPRHIAVIPDGNSRWAVQQGLPRRDGHWAGVDSLRTVVEACAAAPSIECLTVYAFSVENWERPTTETRWIFELIEQVLVSESSRLLELGVRCVLPCTSSGCAALLADLEAQRRPR